MDDPRDTINRNLSMKDLLAIAVYFKFSLPITFIYYEYDPVAFTNYVILHCPSWTAPEAVWRRVIVETGTGHILFIQHSELSHMTSHYIYDRQTRKISEQ